MHNGILPDEDSISYLRPPTKEGVGTEPKQTKKQPENKPPTEKINEKDRRRILENFLLP